MDRLQQSAVLLAIGGLLLLVVYRLVLSPLATFPGPKLAAITGLYEIYYSSFLGGKFTAHINELHERYGPIVRISPWELSIKDEEFYHYMYSGAVRYEKYLPQVKWNAADSSGFATILHDHHRLRRATLNPYFSKKHVSTAEPLIQASVDRVIDRLLSEYDGREIDLNKMLGCLNGDVVLEFCFGWNFDMINAPGFETDLLQAINVLLFTHHFMTDFPWILSLRKVLPDWMLRAIAPSLMYMRYTERKILQSIVQGLGSDETSGYTPILNPKLIESMPPEEARPERLMEELRTVIGAGMDTTKRALVVLFYHVYSRPEVYNRLLAELGDARSWKELEQVEYLSAVIQEAFRSNPGVARRSPRVSREPVKYGDWTIPPGTPFSVNIMNVLQSPRVYGDPQEFRPERWLGNPVAFDGKPLSSHMVAFSKGPRSCVGMNLAYAMINIAVATFLRRVKLEMLSPEAWLKVDREYFVPVSEGTFRGMWARVSRRDVEVEA